MDHILSPYRATVGYVVVVVGKSTKPILLWWLSQLLSSGLRFESDLSSQPEPFVLDFISLHKTAHV